MIFLIKKKHMKFELVARPAAVPPVSQLVLLFKSIAIPTDGECSPPPPCAVAILWFSVTLSATIVHVMTYTEKKYLKKNIYEKYSPKPGSRENR